MEEQKGEIKALFEQKKELYQTLGYFEKDINGLKKDIVERDETIGEKEKRIYELKRKTQELEKVKFVLDYKIKDLKRTIEPREFELQTAKTQIVNMEKELERAHNGNTRKQLTIAELKLKLDGFTREVADIRRRNYDARYNIKSLQHDFYELTQLIEDPMALKEAVKQLNEKYVSNKVTMNPVDNDLVSEGARQRDYLERTVDSLQRKLSKDSESSRKNHLRIMRENVTLIKELNELRRELKVMRLMSQHKPAQEKSEEGGTETGEGGEGDMKEEISELKAKIAIRDKTIKELEQLLVESETVMPRPKSQGELPPMDGIKAGNSSSLSNAAVEQLRAAIGKLQRELLIKQRQLKNMLPDDEKAKLDTTFVELNINVKG